jgi:hypothetical protein
MLLRLQGRGRAVLLEPVPVLRRALHLLPVRAGCNTQPGAQRCHLQHRASHINHADTSSSTLFEAAIAVTFAPTCEGATLWHSHPAHYFCPHARFSTPQRHQPASNPRHRQQLNSCFLCLLSTLWQIMRLQVLPAVRCAAGLKRVRETAAARSEFPNW